MNFVLRQLAGYCLGADLYLEILWVPTWANPGDAPSREVGLSVWRKKVEIAADISLGSLLAQDRYAEDAQRSHELGSERAKYPQPELMTGCSLNPSSVHPRRQVVRRHVVQRARHECWEIRCGNGGLAATFSDHGLVGHGVDKESSKFSQQAAASPKKKLYKINLLDEKVFNLLCQRMGQGIILYMHSGLDCSSFSVLRARSRTTSWSSRQPWGSESFPGEADGNRMAETILKLISICEICNVFWTVENPHSSIVWKSSPFIQLSENHM